MAFLWSVPRGVEMSLALDDRIKIVLPNLHTNSKHSQETYQSWKVLCMFIQMPVIETKYGILMHLNIFGNGNVDEKLLSKWQHFQLCKSIMPNFFLQGMTKNVRFMFGVGETTRVVYNHCWGRQIELVTLNMILNVVRYHKDLGRNSLCK